MNDVLQSPSSHNCGFDSAVGNRQADYLNRWPFAREISTIACSGPKEWSVRIGVYGEWGTGKTSVLRFVSAMAKDHVVVWFDPWEHSTKAELWRSFVLTVFKCLEDKFGGIAKAGDARRKDIVAKISKSIKSLGAAAVGKIDKQAGEAVTSGLDILRHYMTFGPKDLECLGDLLGERRVIIMIDDLDRTAAELVPEILFALKELMDIPRFSFVCAFDPIVVGKVLRQHHRGFGDGLKFLDKIIDYPRWLPPPRSGGLEALAVADAKRYCDFVPEPELRDAIALLPQNPRAVRQFIRLLSLIEPQIKRHNADELRWPIILTANVIKVRFPRLAPVLLNDFNFWDQIIMADFFKKDKEEAKLVKAVEEQVEAVANRQEAKLSVAEKAEISKAMLSLRLNISPFFGGGTEAQIYQMNITEAPHAVTWKEFGEFNIAWEHAPTAKTASAWIADHAIKGDRTQTEVYREVLSAALQRYEKTLGQPNSVHLEEERSSVLKQAENFDSMLECLVLELGQIDRKDKRISSEDIEKIFETVASILKSSSPMQSDFCKRNETLLIQFIKRWHGDVSPLVDAIAPYGYYCSKRYNGVNAQALHQRLKDVILPRLAEQVIRGLREPGYLRRVWTFDKQTHQIRCLLLSHEGPLWKDGRANVLETIKDAGGNLAIQENVYELLQWFEDIFSREIAQGDAENLKKLFLDDEIIHALWTAATVKRLSPYGAVRLHNFVLRLQGLAIDVVLPTWWGEQINQNGHKSNQEEMPAGETSEDEANRLEEEDEPTLG